MSSPLMPKLRGPAERLAQCLPMLRAYVRRLVGDREGAQDVLQNVSLTVLSISETPDDLNHFSVWCRGVARNVAATERRTRRRALAVFSEGGEVPEAPDTLADPEEHTGSRRKLHSLLGDTDPATLELLYRRYVLEENTNDLATEFDQSPAALRMRLMRLRSLLRKGQSQK